MQLLGSLIDVWVKVTEPEAAAHLATVVRIAHEMDEMADPKIRVQRPGACAHSGANPCIGE